MSAQIQDTITIDGNGTYGLLCLPLSQYLATLPAHPNFVPLHTACLRGYSAAWVISEGRLFLTDLNGEICVEENDPGAPTTGFLGCERHHLGDCDRRDFTMTSLFSESPILANWFTGELVIAVGKLTQYRHSGFGSEYAAYRLMRVEAGYVRGDEQLSAEEYTARLPAIDSAVKQRSHSWLSWERLLLWFSARAGD